MEKKLLLIVNPCSGRAKMRTELLNVVEILSAAGYSVTVYPTKNRSDATLKIATLSQGEYDIIVVCGGDGTLNEVITGLMQAKVNCKLGYIPSGTLNEWSSGLNISRDIITAANDIISGKDITLDIGKFSDRYFSTIGTASLSSSSAFIFSSADIQPENVTIKARTDRSAIVFFIKVSFRYCPIIASSSS